MKKPILIGAFLAVIVVLIVAGTKISRLTRTATIQADSIFLVVTGNVSTGFETRGIETTNLVTQLNAMGVGGGATNAQPPTTGLTNISTFLASGSSNRPAILNTGGYLTNAFKHYKVDTNSAHLLASLIAARTDGDVFETGAGQFNIGTNVIRIPDGVTFDFSKSTISGTAGLFTNGPIIQPGNNSRIFGGKVDLAANDTTYQAAFGFAHDASGLSATNFYLEGLVCTNGQSDNIYMTHSNFFSGVINKVNVRSKWDCYVQSITGAGTTNRVEVWNSTIVSDFNGATEPATISAARAVAVRIGLGTLILKDCRIVATNGPTTYAIRSSGNGPRGEIFLENTSVEAAGTNTVAKFDNFTQTLSPSDQPIYIINSPLNTTEMSPGSRGIYRSVEYSNAVVGGTLNVSGLASMVNENVSGIFNVIAGGNANIQYLTAYPAVLGVNAVGDATNITSSSVTELGYMNASAITNRGVLNQLGFVTNNAYVKFDDQTEFADTITQTAFLNPAKFGQLSGDSLTVTNFVNRGRTNISATTASLDWNGPGRIKYFPGGTFTLSFVNTPAANTQARDIFLEIMTQQTGTFPSGIDWGADAGPIMVSGFTNRFIFSWNGTNVSGINLQVLTDGTGPYALMTNGIYRSVGQIDVRTNLNTLNLTVTNSISAPLLAAGQVDVRTNLNFNSATGTNTLTIPRINVGQVDVRTNLNFDTATGTNTLTIPRVNAGQVDVRTNLYAAIATVTNSVTASNFVATAGGTNTLGPTKITNALDVVMVPSGTNAAVGGVLYVATATTQGTIWTNLNNTIATFTNMSQYIVAAHTLTNNGDTIKSIWRGNMLAGTNSVKLFYGYDTVLQTGSFTNGFSAWEAGMEVTRTAGIGALAQAWFTFNQAGPSLTSFGINGIYTNSVLTLATNGAPNTNVLQIGSNRVGCFSNNFHKVWFDPTSR